MPELAAPYFGSVRAAIERRRESDPNDPNLLTALGEVLAFLGEEGTAIGLAHQALELVSTSEDAVFGPRVQLNAARVFAAAGEFDAAITELDSYLAAPGRWSIEGLLTDSRLDPIFGDPRFQTLVDIHRRQ